MRPTLPQKFHLAYHLVIGGGQLWTPLLATPTAPEALHGSGQVREAWTDVGKNAVVRRADLRRSDTFSQVLSHLLFTRSRRRRAPFGVALGSKAGAHQDQPERIPSPTPRISRVSKEV